MMNWPNPILYLYEYAQVPEEIFCRRNDEGLLPWAGTDHYKKEEEWWSLSQGSANEGRNEMYSKQLEPNLLCVGIGSYKTTEDGEIYLCALIDPGTGLVHAYSFGVYRSPELVGRALEILFTKRQKPLTLLSSQNSIYKRKQYGEILAKYPVEARMTAKGTRGGVMAVSTFFSQLMRRKGGVSFQNWQEAIDWLSSYIYAQSAFSFFPTE